MKKRVLLIGLAAMTVLFMQACKKENTVTVKFKATVGNEQWTSVINSPVKYKEKFVITGTSATGKVMMLTVMGDTAGTYLYSPLSFIATYKDGAKEYIGVSGSLTLTSVNLSAKRISGHFYFTATTTSLETLEVKNGEFSDLQYIESN